MILYFCFLITILVVVALLYELCKVCFIHFTVIATALGIGHISFQANSQPNVVMGLSLPSTSSSPSNQTEIIVAQTSQERANLE